jgi:hypothetical protein
MSDPIVVKIGGNSVELPLVMNFAQLERVWPSIKILASSTDSAERIAAGVAFAAGVLRETAPEWTVPRIKAELRVSRIGGASEAAELLDRVREVMIGSGLVIPGEDDPPEPVPAAPPGTTS